MSEPRVDVQESRRRWWYVAIDGGTYGPVEAPDRETAEKIACARCAAAGLECVSVIEAEQ